MNALTKILSAAVRQAHKEDEDHNLTKITQMGDEVRGVGVYRDSGWAEYRLMFVGDGKYLGAINDYRTDDKQDALDTAATCTAMTACRTPAEPVSTEESADLIAAQPIARPRGYHAQPSKLLQGLLKRAA